MKKQKTLFDELMEDPKFRKSYFKERAKLDHEQEVYLAREAFVAGALWYHVVGHTMSIKQIEEESRKRYPLRRRKII